MRRAVDGAPERHPAAFARVAGWARRPGGRVVLPGALITALLAASGAAGVYLVPATGTTARGDVPATASVDTGYPSAAPVGAPPPVPATGPGDGSSAAAPRGGSGSPGAPVTPAVTGRPADVLSGWARRLATRLDVPAVALEAYGYAELVLARTDPRCHLSWTTLAAIGKVESDHGRAGGATLLPDGRAVPPIIGPPLDGTDGRKNMPDTDAGALDGDTRYDHAVGPMQFIPQTWRLWATDADNDGVRNPNDIDDAALAAANYLCADGRDLAVSQGWWAAVLSYNAVQPYARQVFDAANDYGIRSRS